MRNSATDLPFLPYFLMAMASTSLYIALFSVIMMRAMMFQPGMWKFAGNRRHLVARSLSLTPPLDYTATWQRLLQDEVGTGNNSDLLIKLVSYGDAWHARQPKELKSFHHYLSHPQYTKVSGCMANVYIKLNTQDPAFPDRVCVLGAADSRVAQGLLAFMAEVL
ncbi:hypothetical protein EON65_38050 [archaeon]|nr:MAG: hypothetical protein EON65_38050 [archaeon]